MSVISTLASAAFSIFAVLLASHFYRKCRKVKAELNLLSQENQILVTETDRLRIFRKVVDTSPQLFLMVDQALQIIVANKTAETFGWKKNHPFEDTDVSATAKMHFEVEIKRVLTTGFNTDGEIRLARNPDGKWSCFIYHMFPITDEQGSIVGVAFSALDITAQREAEDELNREREFIEGIMNAIPDPIYVKNDHHEWIYGNRAFSELVGKRPNDYIGQKEDGVLPIQNSPTLKRHDREVLRSGKSLESEEDFYDSTGTKLTVLSKRTPFSFQDGRTVLISVIRDISERKRLEIELQASKARQLEASRLATLGQTAGGIAHEINNPLNVLVGIAELMQMIVDKNGTIETQQLKDYCEKIIKFSMRIAKIVKGLRAISRDASQDPFQDVELGQLVEEALELCQQQFANRGISIKLGKIAKDLVVQGRFAQISQIVMNILNNARDAVEGVENPTVFVEVLRVDQTAMIRIWDSGPGVPVQLENQVMNPFFTTKPVGKGTGLGLSISRAIADEHGGLLQLNRKIADSCFEICFPLGHRNEDYPLKSSNQSKAS